MQRVPIEDLRDTVAFDEIVTNSSAPIIVTKNNYDRFVCIKNSDFNKLQQANTRTRLLERIIVSEHERTEGLDIDAFKAIKDLKAKYGLQRNHLANTYTSLIMEDT